MGEPEVRACARAIRLEGAKKPDVAVLCLHGYAGYPGELALPARRLHDAGFDVHVPRLRGHGTSGRDFMRSGWRDWLGDAEDAYRELAARYRKVALVGHSMGGALAVILASRHAISPVVLLAPALSIPALNHVAVTLTSLFVRERPFPWEPDPRYRFFDERDEEDDRYLGDQYWSHLYFRQLRGLSILRRMAVRLLPETSGDILVLTGAEDKTVGRETGPMVLQAGKGRNNWVDLPKGTHLLPYDIDDETREEAMRRTVGWIRFGI